MATRLGPGTDVTAIQRASAAATAANPAVDHRHNARLVQKLCATGFAALVLIRTSMACQVPGGGSAEAARLDSGWSCSSQKATARRSSLLIARAAATSSAAPSCAGSTPPWSPPPCRPSDDRAAQDVPLLAPHVREGRTGAGAPDHVVVTPARAQLDERHGQRVLPPRPGGAEARGGADAGGVRGLAV